MVAAAAPGSKSAVFTPILSIFCALTRNPFYLRRYCRLRRGRYTVGLAGIDEFSFEDAAMPKMKTHKGLAKRVKITATGKVRYKKANSGHLMSGKSGGRCRSLRKAAILKSTGLEKRIKQMIHQ